MASMPTDKIRPQKEEEEENVGHNEEQPSASSGLTGAAQEHLMKMGKKLIPPQIAAIKVGQKYVGPGEIALSYGTTISGSLSLLQD